MEHVQNKFRNTDLRLLADTDTHRYEETMKDLIKDTPHYLVGFFQGWNRKCESGYLFANDKKSIVCRTYTSKMYPTYVQKRGKLACFHEITPDVPEGYPVCVLALTEKEYWRLQKYRGEMAEYVEKYMK